MNRRHRIPRIALCTAAVAGLWAAILLLRGGLDVSFFGIRLRSFDPLRPLVLAFVSTLTFLLSADEEDDQAARRVFQFARFIAARPVGLVLALALAATTMAVGLRYGSPVAGGSDSYGYVSQADLWLNGRLTIEQPWVDQVPWPDAEQTFSPLGYHPGTSRTTLVPSYSAGLPMLMALAKLIAGHCALFSIVPLCGGLMLLSTFGLGQRLAGTPAGIAAAWLLATSPPFLFMLVTPMSDLPAAAFWTLAWWAVARNRTDAAAAGGLAAAVAILIRPNLAPLALIPIVYLALADRKSGRVNLRRPAAFAAALIPAVVMTASLNQLWYGSPFRSGYGTVGEIFSTANFLGNLSHYAGSLVRAQTAIAFAGIAALLFPLRRIWSSAASSSTAAALGVFVLAVWIEYCAYQTFGAWWDLRFLLPSWGLLMIGLSAAITLIARLPGSFGARRTICRATAFSVAFFVLILGLRGVRFTSTENVFYFQRTETKYPIAGEIVVRRTEPAAVIFSGLHNGSLRYYSGRRTLSFASLRPEWLDKAVAWLDANGAHPYALLEDWEVKEFRARFPGSEIGQLRMPPLVFYDGPTKIYLFDLVNSSGSGLKTESITDPEPQVRCIPPYTFAVSGRIIDLPASSRQLNGGSFTPSMTRR